jgi:mannose-6-phosphate isomerase-like protein (cupin superfamily)
LPAGFGIPSTLMSKSNLQEKFALFSEHWTPKIIGEANGQYVKLAKGRGELIWHSHEHEDELFLVIQGKLTIQLRDGEVELGPGEMFIVPKGVEHCPRATEETHILLIEPQSTQHTGAVKHELTVEIAKQEWI